MKKNVLSSPDLMMATEASRRWGYQPNYVRQMYQKYPERFLDGQIRLFGTTYIITRECMEHLTTKSEDDSLWYRKTFRHK